MADHDTVHRPPPLPTSPLSMSHPSQSSSHLRDQVGNQAQLFQLCGQVQGRAAPLPLCCLHFSPTIHQQIQALSASGMDCQVEWVQP